jgi:hypothetical protein
MKRITSLCVVLLIGTLVIAAGDSSVAQPGLELDTDRPGMDYKKFDLSEVSVVR